MYVCIDTTQSILNDVWLLHIYRFTKRCAEVNIINKILQSKQDTIKHLNKQLEIKDEEIARGRLINYY